MQKHAAKKNEHAHVTKNATKSAAKPVAYIADIEDKWAAPVAHPAKHAPKSAPKAKPAVKPAAKAVVKAAKPAAKEHATAKPAAKDHAAAKPTVKEHAAAKPAAKDHAAAKPAAKDHAPAKPAVKDHAPAKPAVKEHAAEKHAPKAVAKPATKVAAKPAAKAVAKPAAAIVAHMVAKPAPTVKAVVKVTHKKPQAVPPAPESLPALTPLEAALGDDSSVDAKNAYVHFLPLAQNLAVIVPMKTADPALAQANVATGVAALESQRAFITEHLPRLAFSNVSSLPQLGLAVRYAVLLAETAPSTGEITAGIHAAAALRGTLLAIADGLAHAGLVPAGEVAAIRKGKGSIDAANDCIALADLFETHEKKIHGKNAATADMLKSARQVGSYLLTSLKPRSAKKDAGKAKSSAALEIRDRLWSLLVARYGEARKMAFYVWGDDFDSHVPALLSHRGHAKNAANAKKKSTNGAAVAAAAS